jgi:hypothetical protein
MRANEGKFWRGLQVLMIGASIMALGFAANAAETLLVAPDNTVSIPASVTTTAVTKTISIIPSVNGAHIYTIQASIADAGTSSTVGHLKLVHTELRAALKDAGGIYANITVPLQQEIIGATLSTNFRYRLTMVGAGSGSDTFLGLVGPTDILKKVFPGHTATSIELVAVFGVVNDDGTSHPVVVGLSAEVSPF